MFQYYYYPLKNYDFSYNLSFSVKLKKVKLPQICRKKKKKITNAWDWLNFVFKKYILKYFYYKKGLLRNFKKIITKRSTSLTTCLRKSMDPNTFESYICSNIVF